MTPITESSQYESPTNSAGSERAAPEAADSPPHAPQALGPVRALKATPPGAVGCIGLLEYHGQNSTMMSAAALDHCKKIYLAADYAAKTEARIRRYLSHVRTEIDNMLATQTVLKSENAALRADIQSKSVEIGALKHRVEVLQESNRCLQLTVNCLQNQVRYAAMFQSPTGACSGDDGSAGVGAGPTDSDHPIQVNKTLARQVNHLEELLGHANNALVLASCSDHGILIREISDLRELSLKLEVQVQTQRIKNQALIERNQQLAAAVEKGHTGTAGAEVSKRRQYKNQTRAAVAQWRVEVAPAAVAEVEGEAITG